LVTEHRVQAGLRDPTFYAELLSIPGVVLVHDSVDPRTILERAAMVFTLTGTVALEAMCLRIPVVLFGEIYYEHFAGIRRVNSYAELQEVAASPAAFETATEEQIIRAFAARYAVSKRGGWMPGGRFEADEVSTAAAILEAVATEERGAEPSARDAG
jgi:hypothetical protein